MGQRGEPSSRKREKKAEWAWPLLSPGGHCAGGLESALSHRPGHRGLHLCQESALGSVDAESFDLPGARAGFTPLYQEETGRRKGKGLLPDQGVDWVELGFTPGHNEQCRELGMAPQEGSPLPIDSLSSTLEAQFPP